LTHITVTLGTNNHINFAAIPRFYAVLHSLYRDVTCLRSLGEVKAVWAYVFESCEQWMKISQLAKIERHMRVSTNGSNE